MFQRTTESAIGGDGMLSPQTRPFSSRPVRRPVQHIEGPFGSLVQTHEPDPALQQLLTDLAVDWSAVTADGTDHALVEGLRRVATALDVDHAALWWRTADAKGEASCLRWSTQAASAVDLLETASSAFVKSELAGGRPATYARLDDLCDRDRVELARSGVWSLAVVPIAIETSVSGALAVGSSSRERAWTSGSLEQLGVIGALGASLLTRRASAAALESAHAEIRQLRDRVAEERSASRPAARAARLSRPIASESPAIRQALVQVEQVAPTPATVLLLGETGVGKEVFAQAIHDTSPRHNRPMIRVSCAAIPSALIESELFGRERGAYTGALTRQIGRFEAANGSTIFLDEIGDLSADVQIKLLRVLQERVIERLGSTQSIKVDVRIIAATNRNLEKAVQDKTFREDLYYRLNVFPIEIPPLRERTEDIEALVWEFVDEFSKSFGKTIESVDKASMGQLQRYAWPGNVRELRNLVERAMIVAAGPRLSVPVPQSLSAAPRASSLTTLRDLELEHIRATLEATNWRVRGRRGAAERLGLKPTTLEGRMAKLGVARPRQ